MGSTVLALAGGWSLGIALAGLLDAPSVVTAAAAGVCLLAALLAPSGRLRLAALALAIGLLGATWSTWKTAPLAAADPLEAFAGEAIIRGRVLDAPTPRGQRAETVLLVVAVASPAAPKAFQPIADGNLRVLLRAPRLAVTFDDIIEAPGRLARPRSRPGWPLAELLARRGIHWTFDAGFVRVVESGGPGLLRTLSDLRLHAETTTRGLLPEPHASLMAGMVFGARAGLPPDLRADLTTTGTSHLTAVSGQNVALVAGALTVVTVALLGRRSAVVVAIAGVWLYTLMVGAPPSALRAATMATVAVVVHGLGRQRDTLAALTLATALLLTWDPGLAFDVGFQLSVTATAGLVLLAPSIEGWRWLAWAPQVVRGSFAVAVAAQLATLPIMLGTFQRLSLISLPANVLAAPLVPPIMVVGALVAALGRAPLLDGILGAAAWALTEALLIVIERAADVPGALVALGRAPVWLPFIWYGLLLAWVAAGSADLRALGLRPSLIVAALGAAAGAVLVWNVTIATATDAPGQASVVILDTEPAAALVRTPERRAILLMTGEAGPGIVANVSGYLEFWESRLDLVVGPEGARTDVDLLSLGQPVGQPVGQPALAASDIATPPQQVDFAVEAGATLPLSDGLTVAVVDARTAGEGEPSALDLLLLADGLTVALPGPGEPSARWPAALPDAPLVARLPRGSVNWLRAVSSPSRTWLLLIGDAGAARLGSAAPAPVLLSRDYGAVEFTLGAGQLDVRSERCPAGRACLIELPSP